MRLLLAALFVLIASGCGEHATSQAGASVAVSASPSALAADCVDLAKTTPVTVPPLLTTELADGLRRVTNAVGGYTIVVPSSWLVSTNPSGGPEPFFGQSHFSSFDPRTAPTPRPRAGGILPPEAGIKLDLELWWNPDRLAATDYVATVGIGPDQVARLPGAPVSIAGRSAYRFALQDERRFQPDNAPLITTRQTRAVWLVPTLRDDRMLVIAATPAESSLLPAVEKAVSTLELAPGIRPEAPMMLQRSDILKQWLFDKDGNRISGRRVEAKLMTYAEASAAMSASHVTPASTGSGGGPGSRAVARIDFDPDAWYWVVTVSGPDLPQPRRGQIAGPTPAPTAWIMYDTPAAGQSMSGTGIAYAAATATTPAWPLGFDTLPDRCR